MCRKGKPPRSLSKKNLFYLKFGCFSPKIGRKREKKNQNPFQAIIRLKKKRKKVAWTTKPFV